MKICLGDALKKATHKEEIVMFWTQIAWLQFNQAQQINEIYFKVTASGKLFSVLLAIMLFKVIENDANMIRRDSLMLRQFSLTKKLYNFNHRISVISEILQ